MDDRTRTIIADMAPTSWAEGKRRLALVRRYVEGGVRSAAEAERLAREADIGRSMFYRLVSIYEDRTASRLDVPPPSENENSPVRSDPVEGAVSEAIARLGTFATQAMVLRLATSICQARRMPPPSPRAVRRAFARELTGKRLDALFGVDAGLALDRSMLDLVVEAKGDRKIAQILCLVDLHAGRVSGHLVTAGPPALEDASGLLGAVTDPEKLAVSRIDRLLQGHSAAVSQARGLALPQLSRWRMGAVVRAALGLRLGRVGLLERVPKSRLSSDPIDLGTAREVVDELLQRRNGSTQLTGKD